MVLVTQWGRSFYSILLLASTKAQGAAEVSCFGTSPSPSGYTTWTIRNLTNQGGGRIIISGQASCVLNLSDILHQIKRIYYIVVLKGFVSSRILFPKPGLGKRAQPTFRAVQLTVFCVYVCVFISHLLPLTERWCDCSFRLLQLPQVKLLSRFFFICFC